MRGKIPSHPGRNNSSLDLLPISYPYRMQLDHSKKIDRSQCRRHFILVKETMSEMIPSHPGRNSFPLSALPISYPYGMHLVQFDLNLDRWNLFESLKIGTTNNYQVSNAIRHDISVTAAILKWSRPIRDGTAIHLVSYQDRNPFWMHMEK